MWHVNCLQKENSDLFYTIPWSHGTVGFLVTAEIRIIPAKKYVRLEYQPVKQFGNVVHTFASAAEDKCNDFVEGLVYSHDSAVIMTGRMTDDLEPDKVRWNASFIFIPVLLS